MEGKKRTLRELGMNPRAIGTNPKALGINPGVLGTNPRARGISPRQLRRSPLQTGKAPSQQRGKGIEESWAEEMDEIRRETRGLQNMLRKLCERYQDRFPDR